MTATERKSLLWSIERDTAQLWEMNQLPGEELAEYERCAERFSDDLPHAVAELAQTVRLYRNISTSLLKLIQTLELERDWYEINEST
jgi:hypothetical protein